MKRFGLAVSAAIAALAFTPAPTSAATITYQLNCVFAGGTACTGVQSVGTLALDDTGLTNQVNGTLTYNQATNKDSVFLNYTAGTTITDVTGAKLDSFTSAQNSLKPDGYGGLFDLRILFDNSLTGPYTFSIFGTGINIGTFANLDTSGTIFAAAHVQAFSGTGDTTTCSRWVGSTGTSANPGGNSPALTCGGTTTGESGPESTIVPEPASMLLLGTGLGLVGAQVRRRIRKQRA